MRRRQRRRWTASCSSSIRHLNLLESVWAARIISVSIFIVFISSQRNLTLCQSLLQLHLLLSLHHHIIGDKEGADKYESQNKEHDDKYADDIRIVFINSIKARIAVADNISCCNISCVFHDPDRGDQILGKLLYLERWIDEL